MVTMLSGDDTAVRRVRFFGEGDMASGLHAQRVAEIAEHFDPAGTPPDITDAIELHHVQMYLERGLVPRAYTEEQTKRAKDRAPELGSAIARFFSTIDDGTVATVVAGVDREYHVALIDLLGRNKAFERCDASTMLPALAAAGVRLGTLLTSRKLVRAYDAEVRDELRAEPRNAEHLIRKYLQDDVRDDIHLPPSFTTTDGRELMASYVESPDANLNYVGLVEFAPVSHLSGVDAKLKLKARRRKAQLTEELFKHTTGIRTGCEVIISDTQEEPVNAKLDGMFSRFSYSRRWLDGTTDFPSVLNNFQHLLRFADRECLLTLPSYPSDLGVLERHIGLRGRTDYHFGIAFSSTDTNSLLQTQMMHGYLRSKEIDLEEVISWFFAEYLVEEFDAPNFSFTPSGSGASYLQKVRHLFAEMESVANQFSLYVQDGELDRELLAMTSDQVRYKNIPTLLEGKYLYATHQDEVVVILNLLFSDQSLLNYINEDLQDDNAALLLIRNHIAYTDFEDYQKEGIDHLLGFGVLQDTGTRVRIANDEQFLILNALWATEAASYFHLSQAGRAQADAMVERGWVTQGSTLLTDAEGQYFNYFLNNVDFSNGPQLRNKYLHGSQAAADGEDAHFSVYLIALRLILALVIKMNDDFCLAAHEGVIAAGDAKATSPAPTD